MIVIVVDPPQPGAVWPCCREGLGLNDGRIYIRADGETREANGAEVRALIQRVQQRSSRQHSPNLNVELTASVHRFTCRESLLDEYIAAKRAPLDAAAPTDAQVEAEAAAFRTSLEAAKDLSPSFGELWHSIERPDDRDRDEYLKEVDEWEVAVRRAWLRFVNHFAMVISADGASRIRAHSNRYLADVKIKIRLDGPIQVAMQPTDDEEFQDLPAPPRAWGPTVDTLYGSMHIGMPQILDIPMSSSRLAVPYSRYDSIEIDQAKSEFEVIVDELRPHDPYISSDGLFLCVPSNRTDPITGSWTATAKEHHEMHFGEMQLDLEEPTDLTEPLREYLLAPAEDED